MQVFSQDFKEFLQFLNANNVDYLVIGGYAVGYYGYPRFTGDLDIWVRSTVENAQRILVAMDNFGFPTTDLRVEDFLQHDRIIQMGVRPQRIDIVTSADGIDFDDCYENRQSFVLDDVRVNMIALADLKKNKKATGRHIDLSDLENLE